MGGRASWKGYLKIGEVRCQVALYTAVSTSERLSFHTLNRATGHRVHRRYVDSETGKTVERDDQVKGYQVDSDEYVVLEPEEIAAAIPDSDKTLKVNAFITCGDIDTVYLDRPYYLAPANKGAEEAFYLIREGMEEANVAAIAQTVIFRRLRLFLVRAHGSGLIATTLNYDYEVRSAEEAFSDISKLRIKGEMLDLAKHIIKTKLGKFDPKSFDDRYEEALADLVKAKLEGKPIQKRAERRPTNVVDLMAALRQSAGGTAKAAKGKRKAATKSSAKSPWRRPAAKRKTPSTARKKAS
jgi:DNA end-binding protein Ku